MAGSIFFRFVVLLGVNFVLFSCFIKRLPAPIDNTDPTGPIDPGNPDDPRLITPIKLDTNQFSKTDSVLARSPRFGASDMFQNIENLTGQFGEGIDYQNKNINLTYSFVAPANDTLKLRPFVLMMHEGALIYGSLESEMGKATRLARKGYAAASINYRVGFTGGNESFACGGRQEDVVRALYRAVQDAYKALDYFLANKQKFGIDSSQIMLAGSSSGGMAVSAFAYMTEADFEALNPGIVKALGSLDPQKTAKKFKLRAILTSLGYALFKDSYIKPTNVRPTLFFQRTGDNVLAYQQGVLFGCPGYLTAYGAGPISDKIRSLRYPYELNYENEPNHTIGYPEEYVVERYAVFIQRLWKKDWRQVTNDKYKVVSDLALK